MPRMGCGERLWFSRGGWSGEGGVERDGGNVVLERAQYVHIPLAKHRTRAAEARKAAALPGGWKQPETVRWTLSTP